MADRQFVLVIEEDGSTQVIGQILNGEARGPRGTVVRVVPMATAVDMMNRHLAREDEYLAEIERLTPKRGRKGTGG